MTNDNNNNADGRQIDVKPSDDIDGSMSIPDQLRAHADRLEADDDEQLIVGLVGVDKMASGDGLASYTLHFTSDELEELGSNETLNVAQKYNERVVGVGFDVGLRDAMAKADNPLADAQVVGGGAIDLSGMFGGGK